LAISSAALRSEVLENVAAIVAQLAAKTMVHFRHSGMLQSNPEALVSVLVNSLPEHGSGVPGAATGASMSVVESFILLRLFQTT